MEKQLEALTIFPRASGENIADIENEIDFRQVSLLDKSELSFSMRWN